MGQQVSVKEMIRQNDRAIKRAIRDIEREVKSTEREQKELQKNIKTLAKQGQMGAARSNAKMLVRSRRQVTKMYEMKAHLIGVRTNIINMRSIEAMTSAMKKSSKAMIKMNRMLNVKNMNKIMKDFLREQEKMGVLQESVGDAIDSAMGEEGETEEAEAEINKVMGEFALEFVEDMPTGPQGGVVKNDAGTEDAERTSKKKIAAPIGLGGGGAPGSSGGSSKNSNKGSKGKGKGGDGGGDGDQEVSDLQKRLDNLRRGG